MRTKRWAGLIALAMLLALLGSALASAQRVYDGADLFTASEEAALESEIARFQEHGLRGRHLGRTPGGRRAVPRGR